MSHPIYFVSLGPGDAELITLKSLHALQQADIIYCPSTVREPDKILSRAATLLLYVWTQKTKNNMTLEEAQKEVDRWIKTYGVRYFSELTNMAVLTEEVGELARIMARKYGDQSFKEGEKCNLADEMADVLWVLLCLANQTGVDLTEAFHRNLEKKTNRDKDRHKNNPKL